MHSGWQSGVQALREAFRYDDFARNLFELHVCLQGLIRLGLTDVHHGGDTTHL